jgi:hypothetical protein
LALLSSRAAPPASPAPQPVPLPHPCPRCARAFRLHLSSKAGKDTHLRATPRFGGGARDPREFFFDSLISNTPFGPCREVWLQQQQAAQGQQQGQRQRQQREFGREQQQQQASAQASAGAAPQHGGAENAPAVCAAPGAAAAGAAFAAPPPPPPPKVSWLPSWRLQQAAGGLSAAAAASLALPPADGGGPLSCLPSPLAQRHALPRAGPRFHAPGRAAPGRRAAPGAPRPVSLLRCEGVDWEALLAAVPPEWRALGALHHAVAAAAAGAGGAPGAPGPRGPAARWGGGGGGGGGGVWHDAGEARPAPSPFPDVDAFVESVCTHGGRQGRVRSWVYSRASAALLLNMRDNRWCGNVGRPHRSNGIFFWVDLAHGTWHQR